MADAPMPRPDAVTSNDPTQVNDRRISTGTMTCQACSSSRPISKDGPCTNCGSHRFYGRLDTD